MLNLKQYLVHCISRRHNIISDMPKFLIWETTKTWFFKAFHSLLLSGVATVSLFAQQDSTTTEAAKIWPTIEARLDQPGADTSRFFILQQVRNHCGADYECRYQTYYQLMIKLERRFNLSVAIYVAERLKKIAHEQKAPGDEAATCRNLSRYYGALGIKELATLNLDKAIALYEKTGDRQAVVQCKMSKLEQSVSYRKIAQVLPEMEALLSECQKNGDSLGVEYLHTRLVGITMSANRYVESERHIVALERIPVSDPIKPNQYGRVITAAMGRADLAHAKGELDVAEPLYQKTLLLCEAEPSRWLEIHVLQSLASLAWKRGNAELAKSYLDKAQAKAEKLELDDLLVRNFELKAMVAEAEGHYADALGYTKKKYFHQEKFKANSAGFNVQNYYLEREKEQLVTEKESKAYELRLKKAQLRNSLITVVFVMFLSAGLLIGLYKRRKGMRELAGQNALIQQQADHLKELEIAKSRFFTNFTHEFRTPLTVISGMAEQLEKQPAKAKDMILRNAKNLLSLVNQMLDLSKLDSGKLTVYWELGDVIVFLGYLAESFQSYAATKHIQLTFYPEIKSLEMDFGRKKLQQIVSNLLSNAIKFTPEGGKVIFQVSTISEGADSDPKMLQLKISDTGKGIADKHLPKIFNRFFQVDDTHNRTGEGTGIGLALTKELVELMGGRISAKSELGKGAVFTVLLPVRQSAARGLDSPYIKAIIPTHGSNPTELATSINEFERLHTDDTLLLLLIEDNADMATYISSCLESQYKILWAKNGQLGIEKALETVPDIILSDVMMPVKDGFEVTEFLKNDERTSHIPIILLTAKAGVEDRIAGLRQGADAYLSKPFDKKELLVRLEKLIELRQNLQARYTGAQAFAIRKPNKGKTKSVTKNDNQIEDAFLEKVNEIIEKHLSDTKFEVPDLCQKLHMSQSQLYRKIKAITDKSIVAYLRSYRLHKGRELLQNSGKNVSEVAYSVGFSDPFYFSRMFSEEFGEPPIEIIK